MLFKKGHIGFWKGKRFTEKHKEQIRLSSVFQKGNKPKRPFKKGYTPWNKGKKSLQNTGENHYNWRGGISRLPYAFSFNEELKELIRKRDNYKCQLCSAPQEEFFKKLPVHHMDYDKQNSNPTNLITLCVEDNNKVNRNRKYWTKYFQEMIERRK